MVSLAFLLIIVILWITAAGLINEGLDMVSSKKYHRYDTSAGIMFLVGGGICFTIIFFMLYWLGKALI